MASGPLDEGALTAISMLFAQPPSELDPEQAMPFALENICNH
jgi:hypothetical protein